MTLCIILESWRHVYIVYCIHVHVHGHTCTWTHMYRERSLLGTCMVRPTAKDCSNKHKHTHRHTDTHTHTHTHTHKHTLTADGRQKECSCLWAWVKRQECPHGSRSTAGSGPDWSHSVQPRRWLAGPGQHGHRRNSSRANWREGGGGGREGGGR